MGNSQSSTGTPCPSRCAVLCWGSAPPAKDDGEWFGDLPRDKKRKKKSRSQKNVNKMPVVPEESDTVDESNEEDIASLKLKPSEAPPVVGDAALSVVSDAVEKAGSEPNPKRIGRSVSSATDVKTKKKMKTKRQPKAKLTFVNGQFVDLSTEEGKEIVAGGPGSVGGIVTSFESGHSGILGPSSSGEAEEDEPSSRSGSKMFAATRRMSRGKSSFSSTASVTSSVGSTGSLSLPGSALSSTSTDTKDAVTSILALGEGHFLTASTSDRVIKMWKLENASGTLQFIRDFVGHSTAITCLAKVDAKGRFLSASKDRVVKLWDSRFSCDDGNENASAPNQILLATFNNMDKRAIRDITMIEDGTYVRPTDKVDTAMAVAMTKKAMLQGSGSVQKAAQERHILGCSCEFATISGRHPVAKMWSVNHVEQEDGEPLRLGGDVAEVKSEQELKHDTVVESIASVVRKGIVVTGDRMGTVKLWKSAKNVFLPGAGKIWACTRTFSWRLKSELSSVGESMQFAITSLTFLQGNTMFVSGSKSGNLRVWKVEGKKKNGETVRKEEICITGAHSLPITAIQQGPEVNSVENSISFSSASEDGKVLSFSVPVAKIGKSNPCCFNVVNHGIADRYTVGADPTCVTALACLGMPNNAPEVLITGSTNSNGKINVLKSPTTPKQGPGNDSLVLHRRGMEEESLTLYSIAEKICSNDGVESRNRKLQMKSYKNCFVGGDVVTYLVDNEYAISRIDGIILGNILATHLSLFECVTKKGKMLEDNTKAYYRFSSEFMDNGRAGLMKRQTEPNLTKGY